MSSEEALGRAEELLARVEETRKRLDGADPEEAVEILQELSELAKSVEAEIERARQAAEADAAGA